MTLAVERQVFVAAHLKGEKSFIVLLTSDVSASALVMTYHGHIYCSQKEMCERERTIYLGSGSGVHCSTQRHLALRALSR